MCQSKRAAWHPSLYPDRKPLAALLAVVGIAGTRQNRSLAVTGADAPAPSWLRTAVVANLVTTAPDAFEIV